ncbi:hypothetical protein KFE80_04560 [bacterium SCSIO 12696]|nr:hypothetical protein KFE80_04560 [bacterium SCSIO 12696]
MSLLYKSYRLTLFVAALAIGLLNTVMASEVDELPSDYDLDPKKWGINSGCIRTNRIRSMNFVSDQSAVLKVSGKKYILMTLSRPCRGVQRRGVSYESRTGRLCARFDRIVSLETGISCQIKSFDPYLLPDEPEVVDDE